MGENPQNLHNIQQGWRHGRRGAVRHCDGPFNTQSHKASTKSPDMQHSIRLPHESTTMTAHYFKTY